MEKAERGFLSWADSRRADNRSVCGWKGRGWKGGGVGKGYDWKGRALGLCGEGFPLDLLLRKGRVQSRMPLPC